MKNNLKQKFSVALASKPNIVILLGICILNILLVFVSALIISSFSVSGSENMGILKAAYYTFTLILDAGCIQGVVDEIGSVNVGLVALCSIIAVIGMISFTGSIIAYVTNVISSFIDESNDGQHKIYAENHTVIINWNSKGGEIIADLLYKEKKSLIIVLTENNKEIIQKEIDDSLTRVIDKVRNKALARSKGMGLFEKLAYLKKNNLKNKVTVIVRQGNIFSSKQLLNASLDKANSIIILDNDDRFNNESASVVLKILMQVSEICNQDGSNENQRIIVESNDKWTSQMIKKISNYKTNGEKSKVTILPVNKILGNILSQLSFMSDLSSVYNKLFSYEGLDFYTSKVETENEEKYIKNYLLSHKSSIPMKFMTYDEKKYFVCAAENKNDLNDTGKISHKKIDFKLNDRFKFSNRNIIILGHDSNCEGILNGFKEINDKFKAQKGNKAIIDITIIDDKESLEKNKGFINNYPFISKVVSAEINEKDKISKAINSSMDKNPDTNVLILSDDNVSRQDLDANVLTSLIYVQDVIKQREEKGIDTSMIDVVVEIIDSKNYDIINNYSINKIAISNKFISKLIAQISENEVLYDFFKDILLYNDGKLREGKEIYIKNVEFFFKQIPGECNARDLMISLYDETMNDNPVILLGYISQDKNKAVFLSGDLSKINLELKPGDKLVLYCEH